MKLRFSINDDTYILENFVNVDWNVFTYDYGAMKENYKNLKAHIVNIALHPVRINNLIEKYDIPLNELYKYI